MVKTFSAVLFLLFLSRPAVAQDDFPRLEIGLGYANLGLPGTTSNSTQHHSGFGMHTDFNFTRNLGIDNYLGYYGLGNNASLFSNIFGGRLMVRTDKITPYVVAGLGGSQVSINQGGSYYSGGNALSTRLGGGIDYKISDGLAWRVDASKLQFHSRDAANKKIWVGNMNISTGIVITLMQ